MAEVADLVLNLGSTLFNAEEGTILSKIATMVKYCIFLGIPFIGWGIVEIFFCIVKNPLIFAGLWSLLTVLGVIAEYFNNSGSRLQPIPTSPTTPIRPRTRTRLNHNHDYDFNQIQNQNQNQNQQQEHEQEQRRSGLPPLLDMVCKQTDPNNNETFRNLCILQEQFREFAIPDIETQTETETEIESEAEEKKGPSTNTILLKNQDPTFSNKYNDEPLEPDVGTQTHSHFPVPVQEESGSESESGSDEENNNNGSEMNIMNRQSLCVSAYPNQSSQELHAQENSKSQGQGHLAAATELKPSETYLCASGVETVGNAMGDADANDFVMVPDSEYSDPDCLHGNAKSELFFLDELKDQLDLNKTSLKLLQRFV